MASQQPPSNPFDVNPFATSPQNQQQPQQQQWGAQQQQQQQMPPQQVVANVNPFTATSPQNQHNPFAPSQQQHMQYPPTQQHVAAMVPQYPPQSNQPPLQLQQHPHNNAQQHQIPLQQNQQQIVLSNNTAVSPWALQVDTGANPVVSYIHKYSLYV